MFLKGSTCRALESSGNEKPNGKQQNVLNENKANSSWSGYVERSPFEWHMDGHNRWRNIEIEKLWKIPCLYHFLHRELIIFKYGEQKGFIQSYPEKK